MFQIIDQNYSFFVEFFGSFGYLIFGKVIYVDMFKFYKLKIINS